MKKSTTLLTCFLLLWLVFVPHNTTEATGTKHHYVSLGDSLAAGQTPYRTVDKGYPHLLADTLLANHMLHSFTGEFAVSGYTSKQILEDLINDVKKEGSQKSILTALSEATIITINAGANDLFQHINPFQSDFNLRPSHLHNKYAEVGENISEIIQEIRKVNSKAEIYILGYYHAFPHLTNVQQQPLILLTRTLNGVIAREASKQQATYVSIFDAIAQDYETFVPNPRDIHLSLEGYAVLANQLFNAIIENEKIKSQPHFIDVQNTHWAFDSVHRLYEKGIVSGYADNTFRPNQAVTRAEGVSMLFRAIIFDTKMPVNPNFLDVSETHFAYYAIAKLTEAGIIDGFNQWFRPNEPLTRAEVAKLLVEVFQLPKTPTHAFSDVSEQHWAQSYIGSLAQASIINGYSDQTFRPDQPVTRAELASMLLQAYNYQLVY